MYVERFDLRAVSGGGTHLLPEQLGIVLCRNGIRQKRKGIWKETDPARLRPREMVESLGRANVRQNGGSLI